MSDKSLMESEEKAAFFSFRDSSDVRKAAHETGHEIFQGLRNAALELECLDMQESLYLAVALLSVASSQYVYKYICIEIVRHKYSSS